MIIKKIIGLKNRKKFFMKKNNKQPYSIKDKTILILYFSIFLLILFIFQLILIKYDNTKNEKTHNYYFKETGEKISDTLISDEPINDLKNFQIKDSKLLKK